MPLERRLFFSPGVTGHSALHKTENIQSSPHGHLVILSLSALAGEVQVNIDPGHKTDVKIEIENIPQIYL